MSREWKIGDMPEDWKVLKIQKIGDVVGGGTPKTSVAEYWDGEISWITPKDLSGYAERYIYTGERSITKKGLENSSAKILPKGTVLFSSRAPIGYLAIAGKELCTNQGFKSIVCDDRKVHNVFLYYLMMIKRYELENIAGGSTFKEVSGRIVKEFKIPVPPLNEQKSIAKILSFLDEKIEVNNQLNKTLEEMAQTIFKHWFVDFEFPYEDGEPYKSSGGEMVESDLGMIPKGWEVKELGDVVDVIDNRGKTPPLSNEKTIYPILDVKAISGNGRIINYENCMKFVSKEIYKSWFRSGHPVEGDILLSTVGSLAEMKVFYGNIGCIAQNVIALRFEEVSNLFMYEYLKNIKGDLLSYNIGSVQPSIKVTHLIKHKVLLPDKNIENI
ncbi:MAG: restriction endonuclease subunit S [Tissierellia bacterium]|nr:restriction endonuclease subunit S [Tissierellia bacterium]